MRALVDRRSVPFETPQRGETMVRLQTQQNNTEEMFFMVMVAAMDRRVPAPARKRDENN